jgi:hypothetical protein
MNNEMIMKRTYQQPATRQIQVQMTAMIANTMQTTLDNSSSAQEVARGRKNEWIEDE